MNSSQHRSDFPAWFESVVRFVYGLFGWREEGEVPNIPKYVVVGAPHTSNWDGIAMLGGSVMLGVKLYWLGKHTLFRRPFGGLSRWLGGVPINRSTTKNAVEQVVEEFNLRDRLALVIAPEGTRKKVTYWKTGFYYIALGAGVPLVLGFIDYRRKRVGFGPLLIPTGDIEADFEVIRQFYANVTPRHPERKGEPALLPKDE